ncbi:MAG: hypothetical protein V2A78_03660 [bacterium]
MQRFEINLFSFSFFIKNVRPFLQKNTPSSSEQGMMRLSSSTCRKPADLFSGRLSHAPFHHQQGENQRRHRYVAYVEDRPSVVDCEVARRDDLADVAEGGAKEENGISDACGQPEAVLEKNTENAQHTEGQIRHRDFKLERASLSPADGSGHLIGKKRVSEKGKKTGKTDIDQKNIEEKDVDNSGCRQALSIPDQADDATNNCKAQKDD